MKSWKKIAGICLLGFMVTFSSGCSNKIDYGEDYNYETDCQYSYDSSYCSWKKIQSDGTGQYIWKDNFIYYYSSDTDTMTPLCNKPNCLHDMETDKDRLGDCNAYAKVDPVSYIQYYDGYIYYVSGEALFQDSLYRVKKDGSKRDKIFTTDDGIAIDNWLIHRGNFYYALRSYYYGEDAETQIYSKISLKSAPISSRMSDEKAKVIFESDEEHSVSGLYGIKAYKDYICYTIDANEKDFKMTTNESWLEQVKSPYYIYNTETGENSEIPIPEGYSKTTCISRVLFLKDRMLLKLYDDMQDTNYQLPIYSINYDLTDAKVWLSDVEQGKWIQSYDDYVIFSDAALHYETIVTDEGTYRDILKDSNPMNIEIYSADSTRASYFSYPMNEAADFNGFGPDGIYVEVEDGADSWSVYELNLEDVLDCQGEEVERSLVSERKYGTLSQGE
jgi:hypothetical protein